jgi:hypothetical protein
MTLAWLAIYWGGLLASIANTPVYGLAIYLFEYYLRPSLHWWGKDLPEWRYSLIVSVVLAASYFMRRDALPDLRPSKNPALKWLLAFGSIMLLVTPMAVNVAESWDAAEMFWKFIILYGFIVAIVRTEWAFNLFVAMHVAGAGWWGWEAYLDPKRDASRLLNVGSSDTLNDNQAAGHLLTVLPFALLLIANVKDKRLRLLALVALPFIINVFILCNSRGATVGLVVALASTLLLARSGHRFKMALAGVGVVAAFLVLADPEFIARQQTTLDYQEQTTAQGRLSNWHAAMGLIADYPFGAGGYGYNELSPIYAPSIIAGRTTGKISPHNTWVLITAEWGIPGIIVFLCFIGTTFRLLHRIRSECVDNASYYRSLAIQIGLIGTLTAATFSDRLYGESIYWLCALSVAAYRIHRHEVESRAAQPAVAAAPVPRGIGPLVPVGTPV